MASVNRVTLLGNVGRDPETRTAQSGDIIVSFSLATSESWKDKASGERKEQTEWHRVVVFDQQIAGVVEKYVVKGSQLYIEGQIQSRKYTDKDGIERQITEIVVPRFGGKLQMIGSAPGREEAPTNARQPASGSRREPARQQGYGGRNNDLDDDIPF